MYENDEIDAVELLFAAIREGNQYPVNKWFETYGSKHLYYNNWSPVHEAVRHGHTEILWDLLNRHGFNANDWFELDSYSDEVYGNGHELKNRYQLCQGSALTIALSHGHLASAEILIRGGADVNSRFYFEGGGNYADVASFFGADLVSEAGNCLLLALAQNADAILKLMLANGLDIDDCWGNRGEENAFNICFHKGDAKRVIRLLELGADPNQSIYDSDGCDWNSLYYAIDQYLARDSKKPEWLQIIDALLSHGVSLSYRNEGGDDDSTLEKVLMSGDEVLAERFGLGRLLTKLQ